jgi:hypothetical protein
VCERERERERFYLQPEPIFTTHRTHSKHTTCTLGVCVLPASQALSPEPQRASTPAKYFYTGNHSLPASLRRCPIPRVLAHTKKIHVSTQTRYSLALYHSLTHTLQKKPRNHTHTHTMFSLSLSHTHTHTYIHTHTHAYQSFIS